jgi:ABC-2 type transport system permease protein/ribosome-dependent ATPase
VKLEVRYLYNQSVKSIWSLAPKLIMLIMMLSPPFLTALGVVREKESGSIFNIYSSTVSPGEFLIGKLAPYVRSRRPTGSSCGCWRWCIRRPSRATRCSSPSPAALRGVHHRLRAGDLDAGADPGGGDDRHQHRQHHPGGAVLGPAAAPVVAVARRLADRPFPAADVLHRIVTDCFLKGAGAAELWPDALVLAGYAVGLFAIGYLLFSKRPKS